MTRVRWLCLVLVGTLVATATTATAQETLSEDFEDFEPGEDPDRLWYNYVEGDDIGAVNDSSKIIEGNQSMGFQGDPTSDVQDRRASFRLGVPTQVSAVDFTIQATPLANSTDGSHQVVKIQSGPPTRAMVEFYVFCRDSENPEGCEFRVRFDPVDDTGQVLVNTSVNETRFDVRMEIDWINSEYRLFVNGVDDGLFPFLQIPDNVGRLKVEQHRGDIPLNMTLDQMVFEDGINASSPAEQGDVATGLKNFAEDIRFDSGPSKWFMGFLYLSTILAAIAVPLVRLGRDNTTIASLSFVGSLATLWIIFLEFWPNWVAVAMIILCGAAVALVVRRVALGVQDASTGASMVLGSLGYFIIASSLLAFAGFGTDTINLPTAPAEQEGEDENQTFAGAVTECIVTGGAFTFGLVGDCSQETQTTAWGDITDAAGNIYGWVRASVNFVYQLLTFRFPIPNLFNLMIVAPPAGALAAYGVQVIRG